MRDGVRRLLELTARHALLYTQGERVPLATKSSGTTDLGGQATQASARVLKPLLEASAPRLRPNRLVKDARTRHLQKLRW